jgi:two-component system LytT family response regulator
MVIEHQKPHLLEESINKVRLSPEDKFFIKDGDKCWFVTLRDVFLFESQGNYIQVFFSDQKPLMLKSLNLLEERLDPKKFFRANRKHIVNMEYIQKIETWFNGGLVLHLKNGQEIEVSRRQAAKFKNDLSI